jgi:GxxExxY protein
MIKLNQLTGAIIGAAIAVHRELGPGHDEIAYEVALARELEARGLAVQRQRPVPVTYKGIKLECGYRVDLLGEQFVVGEIKSAEVVLPVHDAQLITQLRLGGWQVGLLINFNVAVLKDGIRRKVHNLGGRPVIPAEQKAPGNAGAPGQQNRHPDALTARVIAAAMEVHSHLGPGLLASAYTACLQHELALRGLPFERDQPVQLKFRGQRLSGGAAMDLVIGSEVVVKLLAADEITPLHLAQLRSQLKFSEHPTGLILNFNVARLADGLRRVGLSRADAPKLLGWPSRSSASSPPLR